MTKTVGQTLFGTLALIALAVGGINCAHATSDRKPAAKVIEPAAAKPAPLAQAPAPQAARIDEAMPQAKPPRPIAPQTPPPARAVRPGSALPTGPVAIVTIPPSTPAPPKVETKPEPVKQANSAASASVKPAAKPGTKKPAPKKLVQTKPSR